MSDKSTNHGDNLADMLSSMADGEDVNESSDALPTPSVAPQPQVTPAPQVSPTPAPTPAPNPHANSTHAVPQPRLAPVEHHESPDVMDDDDAEQQRVSQSMYASQPVKTDRNERTVDRSIIREAREARMSHTRRLVMMLLFLFGIVVAIPGIWGIMILQGKEVQFYNDDGAGEMAMLTVFGGFSIAAVMWIAAIFTGLQRPKRR